MFGSKRNGTVIAEGLKIIGSVTAEGLVEVHGKIEGELACSSLVVSRKAEIAGTIKADRVVVDGKVEGPIKGGDVVLRAHAQVTGDIHHRSLAIDKGAFFEGRSIQIHGEARERPESAGKKQAREIATPARAA